MSSQNVQEDKTKQKVVKALKDTKKYKASRKDRVIRDMIMVGEDKLLTVMIKLLNECLQQGRISKNWSNVKVVILFKKGRQYKI